MYIVEYNDDSFFEELDVLKIEEVDGGIVRIVLQSQSNSPIGIERKYFVVTLIVNRIGAIIPYILKLKYFMGITPDSDGETKTKYETLLAQIDSVIVQKRLKKLGGVIALQ